MRYNSEAAVTSFGNIAFQNGTFRKTSNPPALNFINWIE